MNIQGNLILKTLWENHASDKFIEVIKKFINLTGEKGYEFIEPFSYTPQITCYHNQTDTRFILNLNVKNIGTFRFCYANYNIDDFTCCFRRSYDCAYTFSCIDENGAIEDMILRVAQIA